MPDLEQNEGALVDWLRALLYLGRDAEARALADRVCADGRTAACGRMRSILARLGR